MLSAGASVLKIGSALAERVGQGEVGGCHPEGGSAWCLLQLAVEKPWSMRGGPFFRFLAQMVLEIAPCRGFISDILSSFQSRGALSGWRALTIEHPLMSGCGRELVKDVLWFKFPVLTHSRSGNTGEKHVTSLNKTSRKYNSVVEGL